ncbi:uncharacterized protein LOC123554634 [Mercenaria mercenaria]|uniref:uncharacterized protein LOC123554634 n=1 Tax=Mercenaria mercenaria TaxID=6596 RepID=UPI00234F3C62|nr:uncharacterized protein LOC123554634 [Mercenaria mercenaria]
MLAFSGGLTFSEMIPLHLLPVYLCVLSTDSAEVIFCYFVDELRYASRNPNLLKQLIAKNDKNTKRKQYCGIASDVLHKIVAKMTSEKYNCDADLEYPSFSPADFNCKTSKRKETQLQLKKWVHMLSPLNSNLF